MARYRVTLPVRLTFDREPCASQLAAVLDRLRAVLIDDYGPPLDVEGRGRFDGYDGPFVTNVALGEL
jgi:hypothetical protein